MGGGGGPRGAPLRGAGVPSGRPAVGGKGSFPRRYGDPPCGSSIAGGGGRGGPRCRRGRARRECSVPPVAPTRAGACGECTRGGGGRRRHLCVPGQRVPVRPPATAARA